MHEETGSFTIYIQWSFLKMGSFRGWMFALSQLNRTFHGFLVKLVYPSCWAYRNSTMQEMIKMDWLIGHWESCAETEHHTNSIQHVDCLCTYTCVCKQKHVVNQQGEERRSFQVQVLRWMWCWSKKKKDKCLLKSQTQRSSFLRQNC